MVGEGGSLGCLILSQIDPDCVHPDRAMLIYLEDSEEPELTTQEAEDWLLQEAAETQRELPTANRWQRRRQTLPATNLGEEPTAESENANAHPRANLHPHPNPNPNSNPNPNPNASPNPNHRTLIRSLILHPNPQP